MNTLPSPPARMRSSAVVVLLLAVFLSGVVVGRWQVHTGGDTRRAVSAPVGFPSAIDAALVAEIWDLLHEKYAGEVDDAKLAQGVLRGLVAGLGDPYSAYADREETSQFSDDLSGSFTGIGVEIGIRRGAVTVITPLKGSPAEAAGIRARDIIVEIDGEEITLNHSLTEVVTKIRGAAGTKVTLGILREGEDGVQDIAVTRQRIRLESVASRVVEGIGIIELSAFHEDTPRLFRRAVREVLAAGVRGIVLDVRNNPGGVLDVAVDIAGHFVPEGQLVVTEVPADDTKRIEHRANGPGDLRALPVVMVMNEGSASAAEILAGVLRDARQAPLVGAETFGKGSVQELIDLTDGSSVRVTIAKWVTPSGQELSEKGIAPTHAVEDPDLDDDVDVVLDRALEVLREKL